MAINLSLSKLPWYGQIGAFVALGLGLAGAFWNFYAQPAQASIEQRSCHHSLDDCWMTLSRVSRHARANMRARGNLVVRHGSAAVVTMSVHDFHPRVDRGERRERSRGVM